MAKMLCALLLVPPPCEMLDPRHNFGQRIACRGIAWDRYLQIDDEPIWTQARSNVSAKGKMVIGADGAGRFVGKNFHTALVATQQGKRFLWHVHQDFYLEPLATLWKTTIQPRIRQCHSSITVRVSRLARRLATQFMASQGLQAQDFYTLHIRRTDSNECDTGHAHVLRYVNCSIGNDPRAVVIFTDERNKDYIGALLGGIKRFAAGRRTIHGDPVLRQMVVSAVNGTDNYLVYAVGMAVQQMAKRRLELRRKIHCRECDPA